MPAPRIGPTYPLLGRLAVATSRPFLALLTRRHALHAMGSRHGRALIDGLARRLQGGATLHLLGIGAGGHNAGVALVRASLEQGIELLGNHEEERFQGVKHYPWFPTSSLAETLQQLESLGLDAADIDGVAASWDYHVLARTSVRLAGEELPWGWRLLRRGASPRMNRSHVRDAFRAPRRLAEALGLPDPVPVVGMRHHDNHAYFSYAVSPFVGQAEPVVVAVLDGAGDDGSISTYVSTPDGDLRSTYRNGSLVDSLGCLYGFLSSALGGWSLLSSEGRLMGAAAWGDARRETNPYYAALREILCLAPNGRLHVDRRLAGWPRGGALRPYTRALGAVLGPPVPHDQARNPDRVLEPGARPHEPLDPALADKAAAVQMVFEDGLFHVVGHALRAHRSSHLVLTGGTALNCVANMRLLEHFDEAWFERELGQRETRLALWVPPVPGDAGTIAGAAYHLAFRAGARATRRHRLRHAAWCGLPPTDAAITAALDARSDIRAVRVGLAQGRGRSALAALMADVVAAGGVLGLFQGSAETGPRALGQRSILADATRRDALALINDRVKFREPFRPLAPMATREAAEAFFELSPGAARDDYSAYDTMVIAVRTKAGARDRIPAVIHEDGTARLQIVRQATNPLCHAFLEAMRERVGVAVAVNTSLNVGAPICQTPEQALETLTRARAMDGLVLVGAEGSAWLAWEHVGGPGSEEPPGLAPALAAWREHTGTQAAP